MFRLGPGLLVVMIATGVVFIACQLVPKLHVYLSLNPELAIRRLELWQPLTTLFVHFQGFELAISLLFIWLMGSMVEAIVGARRVVVLYLAAGTVGYLCAAVLGLWVPRASSLTGPGPSLFALAAAVGIVLGRREVYLFGAVRVRADISTWILCGAFLLFSLLEHDYLRLVTDVGAGAAAWLVLRRGLPSMVGLSNSMARLRLWWLRRRYKVLDGGKSRKEKRWMN
jgi:membrane associated rhomboid family serine protease